MLPKKGMVIRFPYDFLFRLCREKFFDIHPKRWPRLRRHQGSAMELQEHKVGTNVRGHFLNIWIEIFITLSLFLTGKPSSQGS